MYLRYPSSLDPDLKLYAEFELPEHAGHLHLNFHGWHGSAKKTHPDNVKTVRGGKEWFFIRPEMRGRGDSSGRPDCNGYELQDAVDAVEFARKEFADRILEPEKVYLSGGSGGGGNVFAILGKFPDYFCRAHADCGISDYAEWFRGDHVGEFRDEMEEQGWIGGTPDTCPEAYRSRSGAVTIGNLLTPLILFHGEKDRRVPAEQARILMDAVRRHGKNALASYFELPGCGGADHWSDISEELRRFREETAAAFMALPSPPVELPRRGKFTVAGYLKTREFGVELDSIDRVAELFYDLDMDRFDLSAPGKIYRGTSDGSRRNGKEF